MIRQKLHLRHFEMISQLMHLEPTLVIDVHVLLLSDGEKGLVMQPSNGSAGFLELDFGM